MSGEVVPGEVVPGVVVVLGLRGVSGTRVVGLLGLVVV
jgi:hypothetical protein